MPNPIIPRGFWLNSKKSSYIALKMVYGTIYLSRILNLLFVDRTSGQFKNHAGKT